MSRLSLTPLLALLVPLVASAHDYWLIPPAKA